MARGDRRHAGPGAPVPAAAGRSAGDLVTTLARHAALARAIAPARPSTVLRLREEAPLGLGPRAWRALGPLPVVRK